MADARRIIFGSSTIAQETHAMEEGNTKAVMLTQDTSGDAIPGKLGSIGNAAITDNQWGEGWSSMGGIEQYWEDFNNNWEQGGESYSGIVNVSDSAITFSGSGAAVKFVYIKNTGITKLNFL